MIVNDGRQKIMRRRDRVKISRKMEINVFHRHDLSVAAARRAAFKPEARPQRRLAKRHRRLFSLPVESVRQADARRRFSFPRRRRVNRRHQHQFAVRPSFYPLPRCQGDLRLILAVRLQLVLRQSQLRRDFPYGPEDGLLRDLHI